MDFPTQDDRTQANCACDTNPPTATTPPVDPVLRSASDRYFTSLRSDAYKCVRPTERDILAMPWGPRIDVIFDPKGAAGIVGGKVRLMARTAGSEVEIASVLLTSDSQPITLTGTTACDEFVVKATLGTDPGALTRRIESYVYARVYSNAR